MTADWAGRDIVIGSLFSGYGGLDDGVARALLKLGARSVRVAWVADIDPGASLILAHRYPDAPNLGDITAVDWTAVEPVDIVTGGFPCQDVSLAGARAGLQPDTRSGLWAQMAYATSILRPRLVVAENVRGLLSAPADSDVEPCPWCLGDTDGESHLRALGAVLADLADIGYDAQWIGLRAADVGAPHGRFRVFITAHPAYAGGVRRPCAAEPATGGRASSSEHQGEAVGAPAPDPDSTTRGERWVAAPGEEKGGWAWADAGGRGRAPATDATGDGRHEGWPEPAGLIGGPHAPERRHAAADAERSGWDGRAQDEVRGPVGRATASRRGHAAADPDHWGPYGPAITRWATVLGRPAPAPTQPGKTGPRLSPRFVEWMMGLPDGHVVDVPGLKRNDMLKALGNGVVPQQAERALRVLLSAGRAS